MQNTMAGSKLSKVVEETADEERAPASTQRPIPARFGRTRERTTLDPTTPAFVPTAMPTPSPRPVLNPPTYGACLPATSGDGSRTLASSTPAAPATCKTLTEAQGDFSTGDFQEPLRQESQGDSTDQSQFTDPGASLPAPDFTAVSMSGISTISSSPPAPDFTTGRMNGTSNISSSPPALSNHNSHHQTQSPAPQPPSQMDPYTYPTTTALLNVFDRISEIHPIIEIPLTVIEPLHTTFTTPADSQELQGVMTFENSQTSVMFDPEEYEARMQEARRAREVDERHGHAEYMVTQTAREMIPNAGSGARVELAVDSSTSFIPGVRASEPALQQRGSWFDRFFGRWPYYNEEFEQGETHAALQQDEPRISRAPGRPSHHTLQIPKFEKFLELPYELRKNIYEIALYTGQEIQPTLCDHQPDGSIKFHDDNGHSRVHPNHNAIYNLLGVTWASKQIRAESLPCFYSANVIAVTADTATYFAYLSHLNRFHMVRHVRLTIPLLTERWAAQLLEQMNTYVQDVATYESTSDQTMSHEHLTSHPRYIAGGLTSMALLICLRMLTSGFPSNSAGYTSSLTLPVPSTARFTTYPRLRWFPLLCHGLGMHVRYLEGHDVVHNHVRFITLDWEQKFQKKAFGEDGEEVDVDVRQRTLDMYPDVDGREIRVESCVYMRTSCDGETVRWFKVRHAGEGASGEVD